MAEQVKLCPCGSGRDQNYCCGEQGTGWRRVMNLALPWMVVVVMAGAATALVLVGAEAGQQPTVDANPPDPWEYDQINNRHWHPDHGHWHPGPPPGEQVDAVPGLTPDATMPDGSIPEPWEYDAQNNRHWHPDHGHWHPGPPPENPGSTTQPATGGSTTAPAGGSTPEPWEYDAANDQHWHPDHGHWHPGPPPQNR